MATVLSRQNFYKHMNLTVNFHGTEITVTVTADHSVIDDWINTTLSIGAEHLRCGRLVVGLSMDHVPCSLRFCAGRRVLIYQIARCEDYSENLIKFLVNPGVKFTGFWKEYDPKDMMFYEHALMMHEGYVDLMWLAEDAENTTMEDMVDKWLGLKVELSEEIEESNWFGIPLSDDQVAYVCVETYCAVALGLKLKMWDYCD